MLGALRSSDISATCNTNIIATNNINATVIINIIINAIINIIATDIIINIIANHNITAIFINNNSTNSNNYKGLYGPLHGVTTRGRLLWAPPYQWVPLVRSTSGSTST